MTITPPQIRKRISDLQAAKHYGSLTLKFENGKIIHVDEHHSFRVVQEQKK